MKALFLLLLPSLALASNNTPDYYRCTGKVGGEWNFGRAPNACNASEFGSDSVVRDTYGTLVFQDAASRTAERKRYMEDLHAVIRDAAAYYIKKRKPGVSAAEVAAFQLGMLATANQESYWSHYRFTSDNRYKMMRGDVGHGHGLMQVDDRAHFPAVQNGTAWNLIGNMTYSMDEFFANWEKAPSQNCVGSASNWQARTRAAWAAYNGGPSKLCRWTNPNDKWANNDKGFYEKLKNKSWESYVADAEKAAPINVPCLIEKRENCPAPGEPENQPLQENILYRTSAGKACVLAGGQLVCLEDFRDSVCLQALSRFSNQDPVVVTDESLQPYPQRILDRHTTCSAYEPSLIGVGKMAEAVTPINLRATPGGGLVGLMPKGEVAEVLDFEIRNLSTRDRYYKLAIDGVTGFVYAGDASDHANWVIASSKSPIPAAIARPGEKVEVVNAAGINMRATAGGTYLRNIPARTQVVVLDYLVRNDVNDLYYQVSYGGKTGFIYSGALLPSDSTARWTKRLK